MSYDMTECCDILRRAKKDVEPVKAVEDRDYWIFIAPHKSEEVDYNNPYYAVRKSDGKIFNYAPPDVVEFMEMVETRGKPCRRVTIQSRQKHPLY